MNIVYEKFYRQKLFTLKELNKELKNYQVSKNLIQRMHKKGKIKTIKPGLYYIVPLDSEFNPDSILIGAKQGTLCLRTALFLHKAVAEPGNTVYSFSSLAKDFKYGRLNYKVNENSQKFGIDEIDYGNLKLNITDPERTFLDCINSKQIELKEFLAIAGNMKLNLDKLFKYLARLNKKKLYHLTGYVLEANKEKMQIKEEDLFKLKKKLSSKIYYVKRHGLHLTATKYKYNNSWRLMLPQ